MSDELNGQVEDLQDELNVLKARVEALEKRTPAISTKSQCACVDITVPASGFEFALAALRQGKRVRRKKWPTARFLQIHNHSDGAFIARHELAAHVWVPSPRDPLADDWEAL